MHTHLAEGSETDPDLLEAATIIKQCVHCGFCNATCPTYQLLGDELDGPRGRIYAIKSVLEGQPATARTQLHLDRCLTCRACETTCPSGVPYARLADIGRTLIENKVRRPLRQRLIRYALRKLLPYPERMKVILRLARLTRPVLPRQLARMIPTRASLRPQTKRSHARVVLLPPGCLQSLLAPSIDAATTDVLDRLGITVRPVAGSGCCGAISYHLAAREEALDFMRGNIDAWWPHLENGAEAIVSTTSGCGTMLKEYAKVLRHDSAYAEKAAAVSAKVRDISEILEMEPGLVLRPETRQRIAFQNPCSLQHGQGRPGQVERLLADLGFDLVQVANRVGCCGSAGTYSILQPSLSSRLLANKIAELEANDPELIATANIGCLLHLRRRASRPVRHWIELLTPATEPQAAD